MKFILGLIVVASAVLFSSASANAYICDSESISDTGWVNTGQWCPCIGADCAVGPQQNQVDTITRECVRGIVLNCPFPCLTVTPGFWTHEVDWKCDSSVCGPGVHCEFTNGLFVSDCKIC